MTTVSVDLLRYLTEAIERQGIYPTAQQLVGLLEDFEEAGWELRKLHDDPMFAEVGPAPTPIPLKQYGRVNVPLDRLFLCVAGNGPVLANNQDVRVLMCGDAFRSPPCNDGRSVLVHSHSPADASLVFSRYLIPDDSIEIIYVENHGVYCISATIPF